jgi:drug/metabolite transporter (DMT)-like permease
MLQAHRGELLALMVAVFWTVTALAFESAGRRVGSLPVNLIRLVFGFAFLSLLNGAVRGAPFPADAAAHHWTWLSLSGLVGFAIGDLFLFKSFTLVGSWFAMLVMTLAPPLAAVLGRVFLGERISSPGLAGMALTLAGIALAVFRRDEEGTRPRERRPLLGVLYAFGGALGQAAGIVLSKHGMGDYSPFAATQIRVIAGIAGFALVVTAAGRWGAVLRAFRDRKGILAILLGSFFGPFLGVSFSLMAIRHTSTGIASTLMALTPILLIPPSAVLFRHRITRREIAGTVLSVAGVALFFL